MDFIHEINRTFRNSNTEQQVNHIQKFNRIMDGLIDDGAKRTPLKDRREEVLAKVKQGNPETPLGWGLNLEDCDYLKNHAPPEVVVISRHDRFYGDRCAVFWTHRMPDW
jgi:hypothetical protein